MFIGYSIFAYIYIYIQDVHISLSIQLPLHRHRALVAFFIKALCCTQESAYGMPRKEKQNPYLLSNRYLFAITAR